MHPPQSRRYYTYRKEGEESVYNQGWYAQRFYSLVPGWHSPRRPPPVTPLPPPRLSSPEEQSTDPYVAATDGTEATGGEEGALDGHRSREGNKSVYLEKLLTKHFNLAPQLNASGC